jgi:hypothetical protein
MIWAKNVARMREARNACKILSEFMKERAHLGDIGVDGIKMSENVTMWSDFN